jgi:lysophospholipase L1-like esterase
VSRLRRAGSEVVLAPAPDLSMVPHVPAALRPVVQAASVQFRTGQIAAVEALGARVADHDASTAAAFRADTRLFSPDRFHPSDAGYEVIADAIFPHLAAAALGRPLEVENT